VEQGAVGHRAGEVGGKTASGRVDGIDGFDFAFIIEPDSVIDAEIVALAGGDHVVVTVGADFDGAVECLGGDGGNGGEKVRLRLLAAEPAAHAAHDDGDGVGRYAQRMAHHVLDLAGVLG